MSIITRQVALGYGLKLKGSEYDTQSEMSEDVVIEEDQDVEPSGL